MTKTKQIDYYGDEDNYIHLKFGDCRKWYNFTSEFIKEYKDFTDEYSKYFDCERSKFKNVFQVITYIYNKKIPVNLYYNFTDTPVKNRKEVIAYLLRENDFKESYL